MLVCGSVCVPQQLTGVREGNTQTAAAAAASGDCERCQVRAGVRYQGSQLYSARNSRPAFESLDPRTVVPNLANTATF